MIESEPNNVLRSELVTLNLLGGRFKICQLRICSAHFRIHMYIWAADWTFEQVHSYSRQICGLLLLGRAQQLNCNGLLIQSQMHTNKNQNFIFFPSIQSLRNLLQSIYQSSSTGIIGRSLAVCRSYVLRELIYEQIGYYQLLVHTIPISIRDSDHQMGLLVKKQNQQLCWSDTK